MQISKINIYNSIAFCRKRALNIHKYANVNDIVDIAQNDRGDVFILAKSKSGDIISRSVPTQYNFREVKDAYIKAMSDEMETTGSKSTNESTDDIILTTELGAADRNPTFDYDPILEAFNFP